MIHHIDLPVDDLERSRAFYDHALAPLGLRLVMQRTNPQGHEVLGYGALPDPVFWIRSGRPAIRRLHVAFMADSRQAVEEFYRLALSAGGITNGEPGLRPRYAEDYYAAYVLDPDGNNIEAACRQKIRVASSEPVSAIDVPGVTRTIYPEPFAAQVAGRFKRRLGDHFGLGNFGVNLTELAPGAASALLHHHTRQDEFVYVLSGTPTLLLDDREYVLRPGECCGFKAGSGIAHQLVNRSSAPVTYLEIGDRTAGDYAQYPRDDLKFTLAEGGAWILTHKDGTPY